MLTAPSLQAVLGAHEALLRHGKATIDEIKLLAMMCRRSGDTACRRRAEAMLEKKLGRR